MTRIVIGAKSFIALALLYSNSDTFLNQIGILFFQLNFFNQEKMRLGLKPIFVYSKSAIQCAIIPGNEKVKNIASQIQQKDFDVRPILSPTVPEGQERLRFCLHSYNSEKEISEVLHLLSTFVF